MNKIRIGIIGGGASGIFTALRAADLLKSIRSKVEITVLEATSNPLKKVSISGGGRCNVTHFQFEVPNLVENYPRGKKELRAPFQSFQPRDTVEWFKKRGVKLHTEADGRMFPVTNSSRTIIECFLKEAEKLGVEILKNHNVQSIEKKDGRFYCQVRNQEEQVFDYLVIATGATPIGYRLAKSLGHKITDLAPSLFSFKIKNSLLKELSGTSFQNVSLKLKTPGNKKAFEQIGPMLITHWGLSGPAILKLSAWAAREMKECGYIAELRVNWNSEKKLDDWKSSLEGLLSGSPKANVSNAVPEEFTKRFWLQFLDKLGISQDRKCSEVSKKEKNKLLEALFSFSFEILGKNRYKDEFVECGGVSLKEINFKTMESKKCESLYITGELLDIDGITGGFNFQNAWTGGWLSGKSIADQILK